MDEIDYLDEDIAYLLGMIAARGHVYRGDGVFRFSIEFPFSYIGTDASDDRDVLMGLLTTIQSRLKGVIGESPDLSRSEHSATISYQKNENTLLFRDLKLLMGNASGYEDFKVSPFLTDATNSIKAEFIRGFADVNGKIRRSNVNIDGKTHRVYIDILNSNWNLPTQLCNILQDFLNIPVQAIIWGHPNLRNKVTERWSRREHQIRIMATEFRKIGFYLGNKEKMLETLADESPRRTSSPKTCSPISFKSSNNPPHPDESNEGLPDEIRGLHIDNFRQICRELGCWRWEMYNKNQTKLGKI